jgi:hypothetical protein
MADGSAYEIEVVAKSTGIDATASQLEALAGSISTATAQSTAFDNALAAATANLSSARAATSAVAGELSDASAKYRELEVAASKAAREAEKAGMAGKDNSALVAKAEAAKVALNAQGTEVDKLKAKLTELNGVESKHADTLRTIQGAQKAALSEQAKEPEQIKKALGPLGEKMERLKAMQSVLGTSGLAAVGAGAAWLVAAAALAAVASAAVEGYIALAKFAVTSNPKAMERIDKATKQFHKSLAGLFTGVRVDGFVSAFEDFLSMFDEGESTANGLKTLMSTLLNPLFDAAKIVGPYVKEMFKGLVWAALEAVVGILMLRNAILKAIPKETRAEIKALAAQVDWMKTAFYTGAVVAGVLAVALLALTAVVVGGAVVAFALLLPMVIIISLPFVLLAVAIGVVIAILVALGYAVYSAVSYLSELAGAGADAAGNLISGLVGGIVSGTGAFVDAIRNLAASGISAMKAALGIASPSKVMMGIGLNTAAGMEEGVDAGASSMESLATPPEAQSAGRDAGVRELVLRFIMPDGSSETRTVRDGEELTLALEGMALRLGAA